MDYQYVSQSTGLYTSINVGGFLDSGNFGQVYRLQDDLGNPNGFVCKRVVIENHRVSTRKETLDNTINEIYSLQQMSMLEGYAREGDTFRIIMKKIDGKKPTFKDLSSVQPAFTALRDCHRKKVTHFDSGENNFITNPRTNKTTAIDFGFSRNASFINIFFDLLGFLLGNHLTQTFIQTLFVMPSLFIQDYFTYIKENKLEALFNFAWWGGLTYGALYGMPILMLPNHFFYDYLKSKLLYQAFLEVRSLGLLDKHFAEIFLNPIFDFLAIPKSTLLFKHVFKPFYILGLYLPYTQLNHFYEKFWPKANDLFSNATALPLPAKITSENMSSFISAPTTNLFFQAALLYHPIKAGAKFVDDMIIKPLQPESVAKARADLYFKYHPKLYLKAAETKLYEGAKTALNYLRPAS
jgi:serine/threonine protein kinase